MATAAFLSLWFGEAVNFLAPSLGYDPQGMRMKAMVLSDPSVAIHLFVFWCLLFVLGVWWRPTRAIVFYAGRICEDAITMLLGAFLGCHSDSDWLGTAGRLWCKR